MKKIELDTNSLVVRYLSFCWQEDKEHALWQIVHFTDSCSLTRKMITATLLVMLLSVVIFLIACGLGQGVFLWVYMLFTWDWIRPVMDPFHQAITLIVAGLSIAITMLITYELAKRNSKTLEKLFDKIFGKLIPWTQATKESFQPVKEMYQAWKGKYCVKFDYKKTDE